MRYEEYALHYRKTIGAFRVEFYRGFNGGIPAVTVKEIGDVFKGLSLQIQGQQDDIDAPIVKTSLSMSMVDAHDLNDGNMNGSWDFFAQGTETEWMVQVCREDDDLIIWTGYVTPDSYTEELRYRGTCGIIARDNIGQLQNYDFDAVGDDDGMIKMRDLVDAAWVKIDNGMRLVWATDSYWLLTEDYTYAPDTLMNVSAFKGKNWYEVLESVLYAYGAVLRYKGNNTFIVCPLKWLPTLGEPYDKVQPFIPIIASGASLEYAPAVKKIEETVDYDLNDEIPFDKIDGFTGQVLSYPCEVSAVMLDGTLEGKTSTGNVFPVVSDINSWGNTAATTLFFNIDRYGFDSWVKDRRMEQELRNYQYIAANNTDERFVKYSKYMDLSDFSISIQLGYAIGVHSAGGVNGGKIGVGITVNLHKFRYVINLTHMDTGDVYYYIGNGVWLSSYNEIEQEFDYQAATRDIQISCHGTSTLPIGRYRFTMIIQKMEFVKSAQDYTGVGYNFEGLYAGIGEISFHRGGKSFLRSVNRVNTIYNDANNLILSRDPKIAPAFDRVLFPSFIENGIFEKVGENINPTPRWIIAYDYDDDEEVMSQLAAGIHMQLLAYYTKPNKVINGTILNADLTSPPTIYRWDDREFVLMSGTYNYATGQIEGAVLREFARYDDIWQGASIPEIKEESTNK